MDLGYKIMEFIFKEIGFKGFMFENGGSLWVWQCYSLGQEWLGLKLAQVEQEFSVAS